MGFFSSTPSEKKQKRKDKFKDEFNVLTKKDYDSLNKGDKKKYDFAKENNLIVGQKKKGTTVGNKKFVKVFDPVDYTIISSFNPFEPTKKTLNRRFQNKKIRNCKKLSCRLIKKEILIQIMEKLLEQNQICLSRQSLLVIQENLNL